MAGGFECVTVAFVLCLWRVIVSLLFCLTEPQDDIDMESRSKNEHRLQDTFFIDMVFDGSSVAADAEVLRTTEVPRSRGESLEGASLHMLLSLCVSVASRFCRWGGGGGISAAAEGAVSTPKRKTALEKLEALKNTDGGALNRRTMSAVSMKNGWLCKQGAFIKNWKRRWFVLRNNSLCYYTGETESKPKGVIRLEVRLPQTQTRSPRARC